MKKILLLAVVVGASLFVADAVPRALAAPGDPGSPAVDGDMVTVVVTGVGVDVDAATRNAWSAAISQVVGTMVSSETIVANNHLVKDEILSNSRGFVQSSTVLDTRSEDGLVSVDLKVIVQKSPLRQKLTDLQLIKVAVDGGSLAAQIATKIKEKEDSGALLKASSRAFREGVLAVNLVGTPDVDVRDGRATVTYRATVQIDSARWNTAIAELGAALDQVAIQKDEVHTDWQQMQFCRGVSFSGKKPSVLTPGTDGTFTLSYEDPTSEPTAPKADCVLVYHPAVREFPTNALNSSVSATRYMVPADTFEAAGPWMGGHAITLTLTDANGDVVAAEAMKCAECGSRFRSTGVFTWPGVGTSYSDSGLVTGFLGQVGRSYGSYDSTALGVAEVRAAFDLTQADAFRVVAAAVTVQYTAADQHYY